MYRLPDDVCRCVMLGVRQSKEVEVSLHLSMFVVEKGSYWNWGRQLDVDIIISYHYHLPFVAKIIIFQSMYFQSVSIFFTLLCEPVEYFIIPHYTQHKTHPGLRK